jgi:hypothetical protein
VARGGHTKGGVFRITAPGRESGVYLFDVRTRTRHVTVPFAVQGAERRPVLVVLPAMTWQGRNPVDDDGDGLPNTLDSVPPAPRASALLTRPFANGMPAGIAQGEAPLLRFLDKNLLRYDLTTDAALATGEGPPLGSHRGVVLNGDPRWVTPQLRDKLRRYVRDGGHVWSLGTDSLRRTVRLDGGTLRAPSAPQPTDALGARPRQPLERPADPATITTYDEGRLGLFEGTSGTFAGYDSFETLAGVAPFARLDAQAGAEAGVPVIAAWTLGDAGGFAVHTGLPQLAARAAAGDPDADALVRRIWTLLGRS